LSLAALLLVAGPSPVLAQETVPSVSDVANGQPITSNNGAGSSSSTSSTATPAASPSSSSAPAPAVDLNPLDHIKPDQLVSLFSGMLTGLFGNLLNAARDSLIQFINDTDLLRQTPPTWVQNNQGVTTLEAAMRQVANASLALILFWLGLTIATRPLLSGQGLGLNPLHDLPRLLFAAVLADSAQLWMRPCLELTGVPPHREQVGCRRLKDAGWHLAGSAGRHRFEAGFTVTSRAQSGFFASRTPVPWVRMAAERNRRTKQVCSALAGDCGRGRGPPVSW
jgi:hypothetical protein